MSKPRLSKEFIVNGVRTGTNIENLYLTKCVSRNCRRNLLLIESEPVQI
jgi:hypothetical protein